MYDNFKTLDSYEKSIKKLVKINYILKHPTSYGFQYSLNHDRVDDIHKVLDDE